MQPRSILIIGNYGAGNLGDDAILGGIVQECRLLGFRGEITVTHGGVQTSSEIYKGLKKVPFVPLGFKSRWSGKGKQALQAIKHAELIIVGGGGLFTDSESWKAPLIWAQQVRAIRRLKKPYICYGQSIGPLKHFLSRYLAKTAFQNALDIHLRDENSAELLKKWKIPFFIGTDPALSWLLTEKRKIPKKPVLLLSLRRWPGFSQEKWKAILKEVKVYAKRQKLKPILISMQKGENLDVAGFELYEPQGALAAFEAFEKAQCAVTMRLHAGIFSLAASTPFIAISYSKKVKDFLGKYAVVLDNFTEETLRNALKSSPNSVNSAKINLEKEILKNQNFLGKYIS